MKPYPKYKPSDIQWLGDIPEHWEVKKLKYNTYVKARVGWHGLNSNEFFKDSDGAFCVTGTDFIKGKVNWETCYKIGFERYDEDPYIQLNEDDLLITKDGTIGKTAVVKGLKGKATLNSGVFVVRPNNNDYTTEFMFWVLNSPAFTEFVNFTSKGSTIIHLYQDTFVNYPFVLPPLPEQTAIAQFLDQKTAQIDTLIAQKQNLITLLKEERMAFINESLSDESFPLKKLKYVTKAVQTGSTPPSDKTEYFNGDFDWFTPSDFKDDLTLRNSKRKVTDLAITHGLVKVYEPYSVLMIGIGATLGKIGLIEREASSNQQVNCITFTNEINPYFGAYFLNSISQDIVSIANAATLAILNQSQTKDIKIPCPSLETQQKIVESIETTTGKIDATLAKIMQEIELLKEYRVALISEVVTGKVSVV
jgi:type I restriction enzyme, S subunit